MSSASNKTNANPDRRGTVHPRALPDFLKEMNIWVVEDCKQPCWPTYYWRQDDDPTSSFEQAHSEYLARRDSYRDGDGLGVILGEGQDIVVIDGDDVVQDDEIIPEFQKILDKFPDTYAEYSSSGNGIHIITGPTSAIHDDRNLDQEPLGDDCSAHIDILGPQEAKNVVLTGDTVVGHDADVRFYPETLDRVHSQFSQNQNRASPADQSRTTVDVGDLERSTEYSPDDILSTIEMYTEFGSGDIQSKSEQTLALWRSNPPANPESSQKTTETVRGTTYNSPSEADWDLCRKLSYFCQEDEQLMKDCWKASSRWTRPSKQKSDTYIKRTIKNAIRENDRVISDQNIC